MVHKRSRKRSIKRSIKRSRKRSHKKSRKRSIDGGRKYKCPECNFITQRKDRLDEHIKGIHMGEKPFKCDYKDKEGKECKFATARKDTLTKHKKIHINREYIPKVSINRKYTPKPNYNYICEKCNESFDIQAKFVNHILKHPGYKPFKCKL